MYILKYFGYIHTDWETIIIITILVGFIPFDLSGLINNDIKLINNDIKLNNKITELEDKLEKLKEKDILIVNNCLISFFINSLFLNKFATFITSFIF